jgi:hypothetical protein
MQSKRSLWAAMFVIVVCPLCVFAEDRTWTDREGKFSVEAMLLDFDGENVKLKKKEDGKTVSIALEKLSLPDQAYVKKMMADIGGGKAEKSESPFEEVNENAPKPTPKKTKPVKVEEDEESNTEETTNSGGAFTGKIPVTRLSAAPSIRVDRATATWSAPPDPAKYAKLDFKPNLPNFTYGKQDIFTNVAVEGFCFADDAPEKILAAVSLKFRNDSKTTKVFIGDMKTGGVLSQTWPAQLKPLGLSPDGTQALFGQVSGRSSDKITHLTLSDTTQPKLPCVAAFAPFAEKTDRSDSESEIKWADWIDNEHILVQSKRGLIVLIRAKNGAAVWTLDGTNIGDVTLSPGKKYLIANATHNSHYLLETQTGKPIGELVPADGGKFGFPVKFAFSQNGERIAVYEGSAIHILEMKNGTAKKPFYIGDKHVTNMWWVSDTHVLCGDTLVETVEQLPIWNYTDIDKKDVFFAGCLWHAPRIRSNDSSFYVADAVIPHPGMPVLPKLPDDQKYCVHPGMAVNLAVDGAIPDSAKLREHETKNLTDNGFNVTSDAQITLAVRLQAEASQEGEWASSPFASGGPFGPRGPSVGKATYTPYKYSFSFEKDGKTLWTISTSSGSPTFSVSELAGNKTLQDVVTEKSKPKSDWYFRVKIPPRIPFDKAGTSALFRN